jgi:rhodanese-related sulfurtransferase
MNPSISAEQSETGMGKGVLKMQTISPKQLYERIQAGESIELIDVRTPIEYREVHATMARNIPLDRLNPTEVTTGRNGSPLYVICRSGSRGKQACEKIEAASFSERRQCGRWNAGLGSSWPAGCPGKEGHESGTAGSHRRRLVGIDRGLDGLVCPPVLDWSVWLRRRRPYLRGSHGHLCYGNADRQDALESSCREFVFLHMRHLSFQDLSFRGPTI